MSCKFIVHSQLVKNRMYFIENAFVSGFLEAKNKILLTLVVFKMKKRQRE